MSVIASAIFLRLRPIKCYSYPHQHPLNHTIRYNHHAKEVWDTNWKQEMRRPTQAMNIHGNDIASMFKYFQIDPGFAVMFDIDFELKDDGKYGLMTVTKCRTLEYCERHGDDWLLNLACDELDKPLIEETALAFNPKMKTTILKMPPRKSKDDIACQWEFKLET